MSRGLGKVERAILDKVAERRPFYLIEMVVTKSEYNSAHRAALKLRDAGQILTGYFGVANRMVIFPPDYGDIQRFTTTPEFRNRRHGKGWSTDPVTTDQHLSE